MKCVICKCPLLEKNGIYEFDSIIAGKLHIPDINYLECQTCHEKLIQPNDHSKIIKFVSAKEAELIVQQSIGNFVSAREASEMLGMSKQAFSKHSRIKRGYILSAPIDGRRYYLKESVNLFKTNNSDGRFRLRGKTQLQGAVHKETKDGVKYLNVCSGITGNSQEFQTEHHYSDNYFKFVKQNLSNAEYTKEKEYYVEKSEIR